MCSAVLTMVRPEVAKQLLAPVTRSAVSRYSGRSDDPAPTLIFQETILELATNTFNAGRFRSKSHFNDLVKKFLNLPPVQHEKLVQDLQLEHLFHKLEGEKRFKYVFSFKRDLTDCMKMLRISQRPIFSIISTVDTSLSKLRDLGEEAGVAFPSVAPSRDNSSVPKSLPNLLAVEGLEALLPLPSFSSVMAGVSADMSDFDKSVVKANEIVIQDEAVEYRKDVINHYMALFNTSASMFNAVDDWLAFYCDLYGHVDASFRLYFVS